MAILWTSLGHALLIGAVGSAVLTMTLVTVQYVVPNMPIYVAAVGSAFKDVLVLAYDSTFGEAVKFYGLVFADTEDYVKTAMDIASVDPINADSLLTMYYKGFRMAYAGQTKIAKSESELALQKFFYGVPGNQNFIQKYLDRRNFLAHLRAKALSQVVTHDDYEYSCKELDHEIHGKVLLVTNTTVLDNHYDDVEFVTGWSPYKMPHVNVYDGKHVVTVGFKREGFSSARAPLVTGGRIVFNDWVLNNYSSRI